MAPVYLLPLIEIYCMILQKDAPHATRKPAGSIMSPIEYLLKHNYITEREVGAGTEVGADELRWKCTEKGTVFVNSLVRVPEPVQRWIVPDEARGD